MPHRPSETDEQRARLRADHWNGLDAHEQLLELRRFAPAESLGTLLRCSMCGKDLRAREDCHACGDDDVERDGQRSPTGLTGPVDGAVTSSPEAPARLAERPEDKAA